LYLQEGSTEFFVEDERLLALRQATANSELVSFQYSNHPLHHYFLFEEDIEGLDYIEQHSDALIGRKLKHAQRIDELRDQLILDYGTPLDFSNAALLADAHAGIQALYEELHINAPFPRDLASYIGITTDQFVNNSGRHHEVLTVWEHNDYQGQSLNEEHAPQTVIWNYGDFNCFTMAAHRDLNLDNKPDGTNWNNCISSQCINLVDGADALAVTYYKDVDYAIYSCSRQWMIYIRNGFPFFPDCFNLGDYRWRDFSLFGLCGNMNDQTASIRLKAAWTNCFDANTFYDDL